MKYVIIIIKPEKRDKVLQALGELGVTRLVMSEVRGYGGEKREERFRGVTYTISDAPRLKVEVAVADSAVEEIISAIRVIGEHEQKGGGKIFVLPLDNCIRARTGERDDDTSLQPPKI